MRTPGRGRSGGWAGRHRPFPPTDTHRVVPPLGEAESGARSSRGPSDPEPHLS